jgi:hypothetical protein
MEMGVSPTTCLGWPQTLVLLISVSQVARITRMSHQSLNQFLELHKNPAGILMETVIVWY